MTKKQKTRFSEVKWPECEKACKRVANEIRLHEDKHTSTLQFDAFLEDLRLILFGYWSARKDNKELISLLERCREAIGDIYKSHKWHHPKPCNTMCEMNYTMSIMQRLLKELDGEGR